MSAKEFWEDDPQLFVSYRISFINKNKKKAEEDDYKSWLQGLYIHDGNKKLISRLLQFINNIISKQKDTSEIEEYPKKPYYLLSKEKDNEQKKNNDFKQYQNNIIVQGSIKQIYLEKMKRQK